MQKFTQNFPNAIPCYTPKQIYQLEKDWFTDNDSFGLMQQASWQMALYLKNHFPQTQQTVLIVIGSGNNGGDGWALASFLTQICPNWRINVLDMSPPATPSAKKAMQLYNKNNLPKKTLEDLVVAEFLLNPIMFHFDVIVDAIFGIGLNQAPQSTEKSAIQAINDYRKRFSDCHVISIDVPSGLNATDGKVYDKLAVKADITLCLLARKVGLHLKDSKDYVGKIVDLPLIPVLENADYFYHTRLPRLPKRSQNSHKGSYGHVLIIGGNRLENGINKGQGMAGASLLSAESAFAVGVGKVTVACHTDFHPSIITALPNAMTADLHAVEAVSELINQADVVAIGMGMGRDKASFELFKSYLTAIIKAEKPCIIDADGLFHLANLPKTLLAKLEKSQIKRYFTPHSGEAGRLLECDFSEIDNDKITTLNHLTEKFGGTWLIKGANTLVLENGAIHICGLGNAGMATAGMGDSLSGVVVGVLAQQAFLSLDYPLLTATLIHAKAGDKLAKKVGESALQASNMAKVIGKVMYSL